MRRFIVVLGVLLCVCAHGRDIESLFGSIGDSWMLDKKARMDMLVDYHVGGGVAKEGKNMYIEKVDSASQWLRARCSRVSCVELKMMTWEKDTTVGYITTVCGDVCDSRITFYSTDGDVQKWSMSLADSLFVRGEVIERYRSWGLPLLVSLEFAEGRHIVCKFNTPEVMSAEQRKETEGRLRNKVVMEVRRKLVDGEKDLYSIEVVPISD